MATLLEKTRLINKILQRNAGHPVDFDEMATVLSQVIDANCYIVGRKGKVHGHEFVEGFYCGNIEILMNKQARFPEDFNDFLLKTTKTEANKKYENNNCMVSGMTPCKYGELSLTITPINAGGERLGTLVLSKREGDFTDDHLILAEYGATVVGMEIFRARSEKIEEESRSKASVQIALGTLSYSELEAAEHIFSELENGEGVLIASKIADKAGITRSVIVNALRKFESAGVIESKSLGMKGTYIHVLNKSLIEELIKIRR